VTSCLGWQKPKNNNMRLPQIANSLPEVSCIVTGLGSVIRVRLCQGRLLRHGLHLLPTPDQPSCASDMRITLTKQRKLELGHAGSALGAAAASLTTPARKTKRLLSAVSLEQSPSLLLMQLQTIYAGRWQSLCYKLVLQVSHNVSCH